MCVKTSHALNDRKTGPALILPSCADGSDHLIKISVAAYSGRMDAYMGKIILYDGLMAKTDLPPRPITANKGAFGKTLLIAGSTQYKGAAHLCAHAALRSGVGYVFLLSSESVGREVRACYPEIIYSEAALCSVDEVLRISCDKGSVLIGPGLGVSREAADLVKALICSEGGTLVIDADAINSIAKYYSDELLLSAERNIVLTPHPLEFSRLSGKSVSDIEEDRIGVAERFARGHSVTLLLKGNKTVITDGERTYLNTSGSVGLAKAGSGDVLAGLLSGLCAYIKDPLRAAALAAYVHGRAGDRLEKIYSAFGVTPSDLPMEIAKVFAELSDY